MKADISPCGKTGHCGTQDATRQKNVSDCTEVQSEDLSGHHRSLLASVISGALGGCEKVAHNHTETAIKWTGEQREYLITITELV